MSAVLIERQARVGTAILRRYPWPGPYGPTGNPGAATRLGVTPDSGQSKRLPDGYTESGGARRTGTSAFAASARVGSDSQVGQLRADHRKLRAGGRSGELGCCCSARSPRSGLGQRSYAAAKAALHPYAIDLAGELRPRGITVNVVAPGYLAGTEFFGNAMTAEREQTLIGQTMSQRKGTVADVAETVHWLASPKPDT